VRARFAVGDYLLIGTLAVGGVVWAVRLEGRVNAQDVRVDGVEQQQKAAIDQVRTDLAYIRSRIDQALDSRGPR
jgi:hypothetical protein